MYLQKLGFTQGALSPKATILTNSIMQRTGWGGVGGPRLDRGPRTSGIFTWVRSPRCSFWEYTVVWLDDVSCVAGLLAHVRDEILPLHQEENQRLPHGQGILQASTRRPCYSRETLSLTLYASVKKTNFFTYFFGGLECVGWPLLCSCRPYCIFRSEVIKSWNVMCLLRVLSQS